MPILPNAAYTLADYRAATNADGTIAEVINMLSQENEILLDLPWIEANQGMRHTTSIRTGLPAAFWRQYNQGVPRGKSTTAPITETCAMLETYSEVDRDLAALNGNSAAWRLQEDKAFIDGINQQMASAVFYQNQQAVAQSYTGLAPRYSTVNPQTAANAVNVLDAGGRGATNTSIWVCGWGPNTGHGIYPKGSLAGLQVRDVTTDAPVLDGNGNLYQVLRTHFKWDCGLAIRDWRFFARIANIDVTQLTGANAANLFALLIAAMNKMPVMGAGQSAVQQAGPEASGLPVTAPRFAIYVNRTIRTAMELQALNKTNALIQLQQYGGMVVSTFRGIPIRTTDALLNTEGQVI